MANDPERSKTDIYLVAETIHIDSHRLAIVVLACNYCCTVINSISHQIHHSNPVLTGKREQYFLPRWSSQNLLFGGSHYICGSNWTFSSNFFTYKKKPSLTNLVKKNLWAKSVRPTFQTSVGKKSFAITALVNQPYHCWILRLIFSTRSVSSYMHPL